MKIATLSRRVPNKLEKCWKFWLSGVDYEEAKQSKMPQITSGRLKTVLKNIPKNQSLGPDRWHPNKIRYLPHIFKIRLIEIMQQAEGRGRWPESLRYTTVILTPKQTLRMKGN